eukprot:TRINITY_DN24383_c0_g4_i1.p1 TRINITY_DN24383_c0_g4~~TRINITY_DN24383_c0_g4_i1.p1  ORF type:complete len:1495 (+),score=303.63 TRINITY_DN24383_c0_g4_i1:142-4485(+)
MIQVIIFRINVTVVYEVNRGLTDGLGSNFFEDLPRRKYFKDIEDVNDVIKWFSNVVMYSTSISLPYSQPLSLTSFNRIIPEKAVCTSHASVTLTARFVQQTDDYPRTTTERFQELYPEVWKRSTIAAGSSPDFDGEKTWVLNKSYPYRGRSHYSDIPVDALGVDPAYALRNQPVETRWAYTPAGGGEIKSHLDQGGYVALLTFGKGSDGKFKTHVVLLDPKNITSKPMLDEQQRQLGICIPLQASNVMPWEDFKNSAYLSGTLGSLVFEFTSYNANFQALSRATVKFNFESTGYLLDRDIRIDTTMLDLFVETTWIKSALKWLQLAYLVFTLLYFLELGIRSWRSSKKAIRDLWTYVNLASIISSLLSIIQVYMYQRSNEALLSSGTDFRIPEKLNADYRDFDMYVKFSALAVFTIWWRLLQFLANSKARVKLLMRTLGMAAGNMAIYITFIIVIFWGFVAFAWTSFSPVSSDFSSLLQAMITGFELFLGKTDKMQAIPSSALKSIFFLLFMSTFFFVSVQMFNAIINYSYNRVSEEMEAQFEHERNDRKRKEMQRKLEQKVPMWKMIFQTVLRFCNRGKDPDKEKGGATEAQTDSLARDAGDAPGFENIQDEAVKEKLEAFMEREKQRKAPDGMCSKIMFLIFAISYFTFLYVNITVANNAKLQAAVRGRVDAVTYEERGQDYHLRDVNSIDAMSAWISRAMPKLFFPESEEAAAMEGLEPFGTRSKNAICLNHWNCIVSHKEADTDVFPKFLRITQRRINTQLNGDNLNGSAAILTKEVHRNEALIITPDMPFQADVENVSGIPSITHICEQRAAGEGGYLRQGGLVCLLDSDRLAFSRQLHFINDAGFFGLSTGAIAIDFVAYNGNMNMLLYCEITFIVRPSGVVLTRVSVSSLGLLDLDDLRSNFASIFGRLFPGLLYVILVVYFAIVLGRDLASECYRKRVNENMGRIAATIEFFTLDIFNFLEVVSILVSLVSFGMFISFLSTEFQFGSVLKGSQSELMSYCNDLMNAMLLYNRLSALNMLMIFIRPLKFTRENPRMAKLNQTLFDARTDITWFVVMLFIAMVAFVMFAFICFGSQVKELSTFPTAMIYCFYYILGTFEFEPLQRADPLMAVLWFFPYLMLFYCVFTNIFFAIIDRNFVSAEPPPFNLKRALKPAFSRICRCIEWDEDYVMEDDPNQKKKEGPPSRKGRVKETALKIDEILRSAGDTVLTAGVKTSKMLNEICDVDERMGEVVHWSREEAKKFVDNFSRLLAKKQDPKKAKNEEVFIAKEVMGQLEKDIEEEKKNMEEAARHQRYAIQVHERMATRDQEILAEYVLLLEGKIKRKMIEKKALQQEVHHLRGESDKMRFTDEELRRNENAGDIATMPVVDSAQPQVGNNEDDAAASSADSASEGSDDLRTGGARAHNQAGADPTDALGQVGAPQGSADLNNSLTLHINGHLD